MTLPRRIPSDRTEKRLTRTRRMGSRSSVSARDKWGRTWRSTYEARVVNTLPTAAHASPEPCKLAYVLHCEYTPDIRLPNGVLVEIKGELTEDDRRKMLAVKAQHPNLDIRIVLQEPQRLLRRAKHMTQAQWCKEHGFPWHRDRIPPLWYS